MDPLTHLLTGACLGRAGFNRRTAYATLALTLAAEAPDLDMVGYLGGPVAGFTHHRGITHTLVGVPFMALAVTLLLWCAARLRRRMRPAGYVKVRGGPPVRWGWIWVLACIADLSHLLLDFTNSYGLRPFFPFHDTWYAWSIVPIVSPVMLAMLLLGLVVPALLGLVEGEMRRRRRGELRGRGWPVAALVGIALLYAVRGTEHAVAITQMERTASSTGVQWVRVAAVPVVVDPSTWHVLRATSTGYASATVHTLAGSVEPGGSVPFAPRTAAVLAAESSPLGRVYLDWASWPLVEDLGATPPPGSIEPEPAGATTVRFSDLRFSPQALGLLSSQGSPWPLSGYVVVGADGGVVSQWMDGHEQR